METVRIFIAVQLLIVAFLVVFLWSVQSRLRRQRFFWWWAWAWTCFAGYLAAGILALQVPPQWTLVKGGFVLLAVLSGFLQVPLLVFGVLNFRSKAVPARRSVWIGIALALGVGTLSFAASVFQKVEPHIRFSLRSAPRTLALSAAFLFCSLIFLAQWKKRRRWANGVTGTCCLLAATSQAFYSAVFINVLIPVPLLLRPMFDFALLVRSQLLFLDLISDCGICLGMALLLVEEHSNAERALLESVSRGEEIAQNNAVLQAEIRERQRMEAAVRESEDRYRDLVEHSQDLLCTHDLEGRILSVNLAAARTLGYTVEEFLHTPGREFLAPEVRSRFEQYLKTIRQEGVAHGLMTVLTRDGERRIWEFHNTLRTEGVPAPIVRGMAHDITERITTERALLKSEAKFATTFRSSPAAMVICTLENGQFVEVNEAFEGITGYSRSEAIAHTIPELELWVDLSERSSVMDELRKNRRVGHREVQIRRKSGEVFTMLYSAEIIELAGEQYMLCVGEDITTRKQAEAALRESEAKFRLMAETAACAIWIYHEDHFYYFNPKVVEISGFSPDELAKMNIWDLVHPDFRPLVLERALARRAGEQVPSRYEFKILTRNREERWVDFSATVIQFEGKPAILGTAFDITATKRNEQEIRERTAYLQALIANSPLGIVIMDPNHRVQLCNPAFEQMFLYSQAEVLGQDLDDYVSIPGSGEAADFTRRLKAGEGVYAATQRRRKDGTILDVELHGVPLFMDGRLVGIYGMYQDITERKRAEERLQTMRTRLLRAHEEERAYIARELHDDVSQRLALLSIELDKLRRTSSASNHALSQQLELLRQVAQEVCNDLHNVSRRLHPSHLDFLDLVPALSSFCSDFAERNQMEIEFIHEQVPSALPQVVKLCFYRVTQEAIRNVQKHSGSRQARVELAAASGSLRLSVSDSGKGFDPGSLKGIQGLGLVSMTERLRSIGGKLSVQSRPASGTCVEASVPLTRGARA